MIRKPFRLAAAATAFAVASLGMTIPAMADPATVTINAAETSTQLTIHKYEGPANSSINCEADGTQLDGSCFTGKDGLNNVEFTVYRVKDVDLTTNAGWEAARSYYNQGSKKPDASKLNLVGVYTTSGTGANAGTAIVPNEDLLASDTNADASKRTAVGLYFVEETKVPQDEDGNPTHTGSVPFFVTLPTTDPVGLDSWLYDIHVYPKNDKIQTPHKATFDEDAMNVGDEITYRVSSIIPYYGDVVGAPDASGKYTAPDGVYDSNDMQYLYVQDTFPAQLNVSDPAVVADSVKLLAPGVDPTKEAFAAGDVLSLLVEGTDYTVDIDAVNTQQVRVNLTTAGLNKVGPLVAANEGAQIVVDFATTIAEIPTSGQILNEAHVIPGPKPEVGAQPNEPRDPDTPTNKTINKYAVIQIHKVGHLGTEQDAVDLQGVEFEVYPAKVTPVMDPQDPTQQLIDVTGYPEWDYSCATADLAGVAPIDSFVTDNKGFANSKPLQLSNWYNDGVEQSDMPLGTHPGGFLDGEQYANMHGLKKYCLVETKTAEDFLLLAEPIMVELTVEGTAISADATGRMEIINDSENLMNRLPLTGGQGVVTITLLGLLLVGAGTATYVTATRKRKADEAADMTAISA